MKSPNAKAVRGLFGGDRGWLYGAAAALSADVVLHDAFLRTLASPLESLSPWAFILQAALGAGACALLAWAAVAACARLAGAELRRKELCQLLLLASAAAAVRMPMMAQAGFSDDLRKYETWSWKASSQGLHTLYDTETGHYLPDDPDGVFSDNHPAGLYSLLFVGKLYMALTGKTNLDFPKTASPLHRFLLRWPAVFADILLALLAYACARRRWAHRASLTAFAAFAFNPAVIFDSSLYGQVDALYALLGLSALLMLDSDAPLFGWTLLGLACMTKPQAYLLVPIAAAATLKRFGKRILLQGLGSGLAAAVVCALPFILHGRAGRLGAYLLSIAEVHPVVAMNADNLWWALTWGKAAAISDLSPAWGLPISYRALGLFMLFGLHLPIWRAVWINPRGPSLVAWSAASSAVFFTTATQMHENYLYLSLPLLAACLSGESRLRWAYAVFSALFTMNMAWHYPTFVTWLVPGNPDIFAGAELFPARLATATAMTAAAFWLLVSGLKRPFSSSA